MGRIEHVETIPLDRTTTIEHRDHLTAGVVWDADQRSEAEPFGVGGHEMTSVGLHGVTTGSDAIRVATT